MEAITKKIRTPEEIVAWFNAARQRKAAWEKETKAELKAELDTTRQRIANGECVVMKSQEDIDNWRNNYC